MYKLSEIMTDMFYDLEEEKADKYKMCLYKLAYGEILNEEMAEEIISKMKPYKMKWTMEETRQVQQQYGLMGIRNIDFWVVMNSAYNDYHDIFGDDVEMYARFTKDFIQDEDAKEGKVFRYFTKIAK
jgi:sialic acid synthase SpsE